MASARTLEEARAQIQALLAAFPDALPAEKDLDSTEASAALVARLASFPNRGTSRRHSQGLIETPIYISLARAGEHFRFVNREARCLQLLSALWELERMRAAAGGLPAASDRWEKYKRLVFALACTGMPGIGKTRFAREAVYHLARKTAAGTAARAAEPAFEAVVAAAGPVFPVREIGADAFARELVRASYSDRNLRVDCSALHGAGVSGVAATLLREHIKHRVDREAEAACASLDPRLDVLAVAQCIVAAAAREYEAAGSDEHPALLINIDEAHCLPTEVLGDVLRQLARALVAHGLRVFVTVTGISPDRIRDAFDKSQIHVRDIVLPLLSCEHMQEIAAAFVPEVGFATPAWQRVLWWLGGVPRYLQYAFEAAAKLGLSAALTESASREALVGALRALDGDSLVSSVASRVWHDDGGIRAAALNSALVFAVAQTPVLWDHVLMPSAESGGAVTVLKAQKDSLLYWRREAGSERGIIELPPLVLHWVQHRLPAGETLYPLRHIVSFMSARDNEALAVNALMYKLHSHSLLGATSVRLSELGVPVQADDDHAVSIPSCFAVKRTEGNVTAENFAELVKRVRKSKHRHEPVAFVNGPTAPFADAFIILANLVIFIQEKQRVLARLADAAGKPVPRLRAEHVAAEYSKLGAARSLSHVFLFITDEAAPSEAHVGKNQCVVSRERHAALMGSLTAYLRGAMLAASAIDGCGPSASAAVGGAGAAP